MEPAKNCHHCYVALCYYASHARYSEHKNQVLNTWLLSAVYNQATTFPEQGFGS